MGLGGPNLALNWSNPEGLAQGLQIHPYIFPRGCGMYDRRKFRSQTSDKYGQIKSRDGKSQRREEKRRNKESKDEKVRRKKIQVS